MLSVFCKRDGHLDSYKLTLPSALSPQLVLFMRTFFTALPLSARLLVQDDIHFEDVLGRQHTLPYQYFNVWKVWLFLLCLSRDPTQLIQFWLGIPGLLRKSIRESTRRGFCKEWRISHRQHRSGMDCRKQRLSMVTVRVSWLTNRYVCSTQSCQIRKILSSMPESIGRA